MIMQRERFPQDKLIRPDYAGQKVRLREPIVAMLIVLF
jgi:hypothetical protein